MSDWERSPVFPNRRALLVGPPGGSPSPFHAPANSAIVGLFRTEEAVDEETRYCRANNPPGGLR